MHIKSKLGTYFLLQLPLVCLLLADQSHVHRRPAQSSRRVSVAAAETLNRQSAAAAAAASSIVARTISAASVGSGCAGNGSCPGRAHADGPPLVRLFLESARARRVRQAGGQGGPSSLADGEIAIGAPGGEQAGSAATAAEAQSWQQQNRDQTGDRHHPDSNSNPLGETMNDELANGNQISAGSDSLPVQPHQQQQQQLQQLQQLQQQQQQLQPVLELSALQAAQYGYFRHPTSISVIITIAYTIVFVVGIVGNSFVVAIVCKSPRMRTVTNYFIANLALADILVLLFCLPATLVGNLFIPYVLGLYVCKTVSYLQGVAVSASINTMLAVTMDRFLAICFPMDWHMSRRMARWTIACIWLFSLSVSLPWALYFTLVPFALDSRNIQVCSEDWPSEQWGTVYFVCANLILLYLLPLAVIIICYLGIWYKIERRNIPGDRPRGLKIELIMQKSKLKVVKMMMVVVVIFLLSWLPLYLIFARVKLADERSPWEDWLISKLMPLAQWLGASNSCLNPILYTFFNRKYKHGFIELLRYGCCCRRRARPRQSKIGSQELINNGSATGELQCTGKTGSGFNSANAACAAKTRRLNGAGIGTGTPTTTTTTTNNNNNNNNNNTNTNNNCSTCPSTPHLRMEILNHGRQMRLQSMLPAGHQVRGPGKGSGSGSRHSGAAGSRGLSPKVGASTEQASFGAQSASSYVANSLDGAATANEASGSEPAPANCALTGCLEAEPAHSAADRPASPESGLHLEGEAREEAPAVDQAKVVLSPEDQAACGATNTSKTGQQP